MSLAPLDRESVFDIVVAGLGPEGRAARELALELHERTEGDLGRCADGFLHCIRSAGTEDGLGWHVDPSRIAEALASWNPVPPASLLADVPARLLARLRICARIGRSFPARLAQELLALFAGPGDLPFLLDHGYLVAEEGERLRFVTKSFFHEVAAGGVERSTEIDSWLNTHHVPAPDLVDEVLEACLRARRVGDTTRESSYLAAALERADDQRRPQDALRLLAYPGTAPATRTMELVHQQIDTLMGILGPPWSRGQLLLVAAMAEHTPGSPLKTPLLEEAAGGSDPKAAIAALTTLADWSSGKPGNPSNDGYMKQLREASGLRGGPSPGVLEFLDARRALVSGNTEAAADLAESAARALSGSGLVYEAVNLQLLAILQFSRDQEKAARTLREAIATARDAERSAQMHYNLALMYNQMGKLELSAACADEGIRQAPAGLPGMWILGLRTRRAWAWADLDRIGPAREEARALLGTPAARSSPMQGVAIRLLLGFCHLHRGAGLDAIREVAQARHDAFRGCPAAQRWDSLRLLVDVLLDLEAWDRVHEYGASMSESANGNDAFATTTSARARALVAQGRGDLAMAAGLLEEQLHALPTVEDLHSRARYLHHLGIVQMARSLESLDAAAAERAADMFEKAIETLGEPGNGYYRARAQLGVADARRAAGTRRSAAAALQRAIAIAREIGSQGLLAQCLQTRARMHMERP